jgi:hypothetical protein
MKILTLLLVLLIAVPPVQAGGCAMDHGPDSADSAMAGHDCCPERQADPAPADSACDGPSHRTGAGRCSVVRRPGRHDSCSRAVAQPRPAAIPTSNFLIFSFDSFDICAVR